MKEDTKEIPKSKKVDYFIHRREELGKHICYGCFKKGKEIEMQTKILSKNITIFICPKCQKQYN